MAGDWIKMRPSLLTSPKVNGIARILESDKNVSRALTTGFSGSMSEIVTRNVMRNVTVASLLVIWGAANEHTSDGVFHDADLSDLDDMVGIPGFGEAMESVGWVVYNEEDCSVTLPNFIEYNTTGKERSATAKSNAERQKEYRDRKKSNENNVTRNVTRNRREEKRREEKRREEKRGISINQSINCPDAFAMHKDWFPDDDTQGQLSSIGIIEDWTKFHDEFVNHWMSKPAEKFLHPEWQNKFIKNVEWKIANRVVEFG